MNETIREWQKEVGRERVFFSHITGKITGLNLSSRNLKKTPNELGKLVDLQWIDLSDNPLTSIPALPDSIRVINLRGIAIGSLRSLLPKSCFRTVEYTSYKGLKPKKAKKQCLRFDLELKLGGDCIKIELGKSIKPWVAPPHKKKPVEPSMWAEGLPKTTFLSSVDREKKLAEEKYLRDVKHDATDRSAWEIIDLPKIEERYDMSDDAFTNRQVKRLPMEERVKKSLLDDHDYMKRRECGWGKEVSWMPGWFDYATYVDELFEEAPHRMPNLRHKMFLGKFKADLEAMKPKKEVSVPETKLTYLGSLMPDSLENIFSALMKGVKVPWEKAREDRRTDDVWNDVSIAVSKFIIAVYYNSNKQSTYIKTPDSASISNTYLIAGLNISDLWGTAAFPGVFRSLSPGAPVELYLHPGNGRLIVKQHFSPVFGTKFELTGEEVNA
jgi:hypothetical protein